MGPPGKALHDTSCDHPHGSVLHGMVDSSGGQHACWPFTGKTSRGGYGLISKGHSAHRCAWEEAGGVRPGSMCVCHSCDNRRCCNPAHLFLGTRVDNMRDMQQKARGKNGKGLRRPPEPLTPDEVNRLLRAPSARAPTGVRNRALLVVLYRAGLRISEALALEPKDIDRQAGTLRVLHGKGDKSRTVGMDPEAFSMLERWLDVRASLGHNGRAPVFCTLAGGRVATNYVRAMLPRMARRAGIEKRVHAHGLRHTMAAEMRAEGQDIGVISKALGHSSIATTARYLDHVAPTAVVDAMRKREWLK